MERIVKIFVNAIRITVFLVIPGLVFKIWNFYFIFNYQIIDNWFILFKARVFVSLAIPESTVTANALHRLMANFVIKFATVKMEHFVITWQVNVFAIPDGWALSVRSPAFRAHLESDALKIVRVLEI
jgi:hypothetical protein